MIGIVKGRVMIYIILAVGLLVVMTLAYRSYQKNGDTTYLLKTISLIFAVLFFTYISKVIFIHKPIFILHLTLLFLSWGALFNFLIKGRLNLFMILSPALSTTLFFAIALFFRENA